MTQKILAHTRQTRTQFGDPICLQYYLVTDELSFDGGSLESYGMEVVLRRSGTDQQESCMVRHITPLPCRILQLLLRVADGTVTPCTLRQTLADLL